MNNQLKETFRNAIDRREVTRNMLLLGLVNLDEKMKYFNEKLQRLESDWKTLIDTALNHGIDIEEINEQLWQIDPDKNEITNEVLAALIKLCGEEHRIGNECVRDELIKLKDVNTSIKSDAKEHKRGLKQTDRAADNDQRGFLELCDYIGQELWGTELDSSQRERLKELCKETSYSYLVILRSFQFGTPEIRDLESYHRHNLKYIFSVAKKYLQQERERLEEEEFMQDQIQYIDLSCHKIKEWNYRGTGSQPGAAMRIKETEARIRRLIHEDDEELDISELL